MKILVINGPNLNMLGVREPGIYGAETLAQINEWLNSQPEAAGHELEFFQSNSEGALIDKIQDAFNKVDGIIINPGAYTHYSYALRDVLAAVGIPTVEVHLSAIEERESFRKISVIKDVCIAQITGQGKNSYLSGLKYLLTARKK